MFRKVLFSFLEFFFVWHWLSFSTLPQDRQKGLSHSTIHPWHTQNFIFNQSVSEQIVLKIFNCNDYFIYLSIFICSLFEKNAKIPGRSDHTPPPNVLKFLYPFILWAGRPKALWGLGGTVQSRKTRMLRSGRIRTQKTHPAEEGVDQ